MYCYSLFLKRSPWTFKTWNSSIFSLLGQTRSVQSVIALMPCQSKLLSITMHLLNISRRIWTIVADRAHTLGKLRMHFRGPSHPSCPQQRMRLNPSRSFSRSAEASGTNLGTKTCDISSLLASVETSFCIAFCGLSCVGVWARTWLQVSGR